MLESCGKHPHEMGVAICRRCGGSWCSTCLVYAFGPKKPPFCMSCAMVAGGVRSASSQPAMSRKQMKAQTKALKAQAKAQAARDAGQPSEESEEPTPELADALAETDWTAPWWEDRQPTMAD
jgi:hypothetical protein